MTVDGASASQEWSIPGPRTRYFRQANLPRFPPFGTRDCPGGQRPAVATLRPRLHRLQVQQEPLTEQKQSSQGTRELARAGAAPRGPLRFADRGLAHGLTGLNVRGKTAPGGRSHPEHRAEAVLGRVADEDRAAGLSGLDALRAAVVAVAGLAPAVAYFCWLCQNVIASVMRVRDSATLRA